MDKSSKAKGAQKIVGYKGSGQTGSAPMVDAHGQELQGEGCPEDRRIQGLWPDRLRPHGRRSWTRAPRRRVPRRSSDTRALARPAPPPWSTRRDRSPSTGERCTSSPTSTEETSTSSPPSSPRRPGSSLETTTSQALSESPSGPSDSSPSSQLVCSPFTAPVRSPKCFRGRFFPKPPPPSVFLQREGWMGNGALHRSGGRIEESRGFKKWTVPT